LQLQDEPLGHRVAIRVEVDDAEVDKYYLWNWANDRSHELAADLGRRGAGATVTVTPVSDDGATTPCPVCGTAFRPSGRQRFCSTGCRQAAFRRKLAAPRAPVVAKSATVYACPQCEARYLGEQRCEDCNSWCRRLGPGALCPACDEPVAMSDLFTKDQLAKDAAVTPGGK
jgi:hypothetical protein